MGRSVPLSRRLRAGTSTHTLLVVTPCSQPLLSSQLQLPLQLRARFLAMYEIAESTPDTSFPAIEPTTRFSEVGHGGQFAVDWAGGVPTAVERVAGGLGGVFVFEARVDVADEVCIGGEFVRVDLKKCMPKGRHLRSLLLSHTTTSSISPYLHISHQKSS